MSLPRYPEYKSGGESWLGQLPSHWEVTPLKYLVDLRSGGTPSKENPAYWNGDVPWASAKDLKTDQLAATGDYITQHALSSGAASLVPAGAVLVVVRGMILARTFPVTETLLPMAINQDLKAVIPRERITGAFLAWLLRGTSDESLLRLDEAGHGTKALRMDAWTSMRMPVPPFAEQESIVDFLACETAKIDALIAEQEQLIALLAEKRQATISHAVTRGLNPDVPTKDSDVAWLGDVPAHWSVGKIQSFARRESGHTPSRQHPEYWENCTVPWFSLADVWQIRDGNLKYVYETKEMVSELGIANSSARLLPAGTVMLSRTASVGYSAIMGCDMATTQDFINWVCGPLLKPEFLLYVLRGMRSEFDRLMMGSTHQTIYMPDVAKLMMTLPPLHEQATIIAFLDRATAKLDALRDGAERAIGLLKERRSALIAAAVTGQIDVRGAVPDLSLREELAA